MGRCNWGGEGGKPEVGYTFHYGTGRSTVSLISDRNRENP